MRLKCAGGLTDGMRVKIKQNELPMFNRGKLYISDKTINWDLIGKTCRLLRVQHQT